MIILVDIDQFYIITNLNIVTNNSDFREDNIAIIVKINENIILPNEIYNMYQLRRFNIYNFRAGIIIDKILNLINLKTLMIQYCKIRFISENLAKLNKLCNFHFYPSRKYDKLDINRDSFIDSIKKYNTDNKYIKKN